MGKWTHRLSGINTETLEAFCSACGKVKVNMKGGRWKCTVARKEQRGNWRNTPSYIKRKEHKIPRSKTTRVSKGKGFAHLRGDHCEICGSSENLCGDHNHATGKFRGTLCRGCNFGIGFFKDQIALLSEAIAYLSK